MSKKLFVSSIPNFSENSINSFCWFLENGISKELRKFSSSLHFSDGTDVRVYSDEFILKKPAYSPTQCKNYNLSYSIRVYVPMDL